MVAGSFLATLTTGTWYDPDPEWKPSWIANSRSVLSVVYATSVFCARTKTLSHRLQVPSHYVSISYRDGRMSEDHTFLKQILKTSDRGRPQGIRKAELPSLSPRLYCSPCHHIYYVFRPTVHFGASLVEWLYIPYGCSHLQPMIDLIDYHSHDCHHCHIWLWWAVHLCMLFISNWNVNP